MIQCDYLQDNSVRYFTDDLPLRRIFKEQIVRLEIVNEDHGYSVGSNIQI